ncbi:transporter associated domain-containing protein [Treponema phagedenis]|uniref:transporter associated domain-containing protein n=1 Tax=Treponema phagedenis TaxID=162 RepID=UPI0004671302|nr:transporter associated domain-containing protein [Treponema phagedenis]
MKSGKKESGKNCFSAQRKIGAYMTHRSDIIWIDIVSTKEDVLRLITENPHIEYFPVCANIIDTVIGYISVRSYLLACLADAPPNLRVLIQKPFFIPETVAVRKTLALIKETDARIAFIIDEYGGIEGLITKNGLLTEILEETALADGVYDPDIFKKDDGSWVVSGQVSMDEIRTIGIIPKEQEKTEDFHTIAGYLLSIKDSIPQAGEKICFGKYRFTILKMDGRRIDKILIQEEPEEDR